MDNVNEIYVYENWKSDTPSLIGTLYVDGGRGITGNKECCRKQLEKCKLYLKEWISDKKQYKQKVLKREYMENFEYI